MKIDLESIYGFLLLSIPWIAAYILMMLIKHAEYTQKDNIIRIVQTRNQGLENKINQLKKENKKLKERLEDGR
jgi:hypothetical protein